MLPSAAPSGSGAPGQQPMAAAMSQDGAPQLGGSFAGQRGQGSAPMAAAPFQQQLQQQQRFSMEGLFQVCAQFSCRFVPRQSAFSHGLGRCYATHPLISLECWTLSHRNACLQGGGQPGGPQGNFGELPSQQQQHQAPPSLPAMPQRARTLAELESLGGGGGMSALAAPRASPGAQPAATMQ
jgi:hypothetical protein